MKGKDLALKIVAEVSRIILGVTFTFSGFVKTVDPMGTAYKIEDYFAAFNLHSLSSLSLPLSVAQGAFEFILGIFLIIGIYRRINTILILITMLFMTPLTLYLAIANPVSDCGCFGDALIISNWETFYKNIVLLACSIFLFFNFYRITNFFTGKFYWVVGIFTTFYIVAFSIYNCVYEPIFDFRPYKIGANLPKLMNLGTENGDVFENIMIYEKDGVRKEFTEQNYPWQDTTWVFVEMKTKLIKEGEKSVIHDFEINKLTFNQEKTEIVLEENITEEALSDTSYVFLMIAYSLNEMNISYLSSFEDVNNYANEHRYKFYCLTSSTTEDILNWEKENRFNLTYCRTDERTLKTITRSQPGLILLKNGIIINKWADLEVPQENELIKPLDQMNISRVDTVDQTEKKNIIYLVLSFVLPLIAVKIFDFTIYQRKRRRKEEEETIG